MSSLKQAKQKRKILDMYHAQLRKMLSNTDIINTLYGFDHNVGEKIIEYPQLANYRTINELLPNDLDYRIVLIESQPHSGHWTVLWKNRSDNNSIGWWDPYGGNWGKPDSELKTIPMKMREILGESHPLLINLLQTLEPDQHFVYNKIKFQSEGDVTTCGRWACIRCIYLLLGYTNSEFETKLKSLKRDSDKPFDIIAVDLTGKF